MAAEMKLFPQLGARFTAKVRWALLTATSTLLISLWCLRPETREELPSSSFGAFVTIFLTDRSLGRTLRTSADSVFGAGAAITLAWVFARFVHGTNSFLTAGALFLQSLFWAYVDIPLAGRRLALSTMVIVCLSAYNSPQTMEYAECARFAAVVGLSAAIALFALLVPLGPQCSVPMATSSGRAAANAVQTIISKTVAAFLQPNATYQHISKVQLSELSRAASNNLRQWGVQLDDAQWELRVPWGEDPLNQLRQQRKTLAELLEMAEGAHRTLATLPFNACHAAFAMRLHKSLMELASALDNLVPLAGSRVGAEDEQRLANALSNFHTEYGRARRELLYPESAWAGTSWGISFQTVSWQMEDLLHMNAFLFTLMHVAACVLAHHGTAPTKAHGRAASWAKHCTSLIAAFCPSRPLHLDKTRLRSAVRFSVAICLAALLSLLPPFRSKFKLEIWAPVEVTFLMFQHGGGSLRQSVLRLLGAILGSVVGYLIALFLQEQPIELVAFSLAIWSFASCLFRDSATHGYAAIVAAWTAVIVAAAGTAAGPSGATIPALERMTHTVIGVAALVVTINIVFPIWSRDAARSELTSVLGQFQELFTNLQNAWVERSREMQSQMSEDNRGEEDILLQEGHGESNPVIIGKTMIGCSAAQPPKTEKGSAALAKISRSLVGLCALISEASAEPSLCRPEYQPEASRQVVRLLEKMRERLEMFSIYLEREPSALVAAFGGQTLTRWLSRDWMHALKGTSQDIVKVLVGLQSALEGDRRYLSAISVEGLEANLRHELGSFLKRYEWILSGTISDSQLKILAGTQTEQSLTNWDMLLYNSLVFTMQGFVEQLLDCSRAVRELVLVEGDASVFDTRELSERPSKIHDQICNAATTGPDVANNSPMRLPVINIEDGETRQLILTVVGPDRLGIVHDVARTVFSHGGNVAASRMAKLDGDFAIVMNVRLPDASVGLLEAELQRCLLGLQVTLKPAKDHQKVKALAPYQAEVHCICPVDAPGLLVRLTSVLVGAKLNLLALDTELRPAPRGTGFAMRALVGSETPIDMHSLDASLKGLHEGAGLGMAAHVKIVPEEFIDQQGTRSPPSETTHDDNDVVFL